MKCRKCNRYIAYEVIVGGSQTANTAEPATAVCPRCGHCVEASPGQARLEAARPRPGRRVQMPRPDPFGDPFSDRSRG